MNPSSQAYLYALLAVLCWSTVAVAFKFGLVHFSPAQLLLFAIITSTITLGIILNLQGRGALLWQQSRRAWLTAVVLGAINPFIYYLILFQAYQLLPAQEAQSINYSWALTMSLLAVPLLGHRLRKRDGIAALLCYFGVVVIATHGHPFTLTFSNTLGVILALLSTVLWALYWIFNTRDLRDPVVALLMNFICSIPMILLYCLLTGELEQIKWQGLHYALYVGVFEMGLTFVLWQTAMKLTNNTSSISNLIFISPFLSLILIYLLLGETILMSTLWGLLLIITGLMIQQWRWKA